MARRHILASHLLPIALVLMTALGLSCSSNPPRDMWFGTDAGAGFEAPVQETGEDSADTGDADTASASDTTDDTTSDTADDTSAPDASTD